MVILLTKRLMEAEAERKKVLDLLSSLNVTSCLSVVLVGCCDLMVADFFIPYLKLKVTFDGYKNVFMHVNSIRYLLKIQYG